MTEKTLDLRQPKDTTKWMAIYEGVTVEGELIKFYRLTRAGLDKLNTAATQEDVRLLRNELHELKTRLSLVMGPLIEKWLARNILKALKDGKPHRIQTISKRIAYGQLFRYSEFFDVLEKLEKAGRIMRAHGSWRLKKID